MKLPKLVCVLLLGTAPISMADLNENGFDGYAEGDLLGQHDWRPQGRSDERGYSNMPGRAVIKLDPATGNRYLVWNAGFDNREQTRILKKFPATGGMKAVAKFGIIPGKATVPGQLIFDFERSGSISLRFMRGTLHISNDGSPQLKDSEVAFYPNEWNKVELHFDFETHTLQAYLNGRDAGQYQLPTSMNGINELNFFAGGTDFESALDNLSIETVEAFSAPEKNR